MRSRFLPITAAWVALLAGCDSTGPVCTLEPVTGLRIELVDAVEGGLITSDEIEVMARDGDHVETSRSQPIVGLAEERRGVYEIEASAAGYTPWDTSGVVVTQAVCHVITAEITARMQPVDTD